MQATIVQPVSASLLAASATALVSTTAKSIPIVVPTGGIQPTASALFLTPGTWLLTGYINFVLAATTTASLMRAGFSQTTNTLPATDAGLIALQAAFTAGLQTDVLVLPSIVVNVPAQGQNWFLVGELTFAVSTATAFGTFNALLIAA